MCRVWGVGCGVWGVGCGVWGVGCGVWNVECGVCGVGCRTKGAGWRVEGDLCLVAESVDSPMHHDDRDDWDQQVVNEELSL